MLTLAAFGSHLTASWNQRSVTSPTAEAPESELWLRKQQCASHSAPVRVTTPARGDLESCGQGRAQRSGVRLVKSMGDGSSRLFRAARVHYSGLQRDFAWCSSQEEWALYVGCKQHLPCLALALHVVSCWTYLEVVCCLWGTKRFHGSNTPFTWGICSNLNAVLHFIFFRFRSCNAKSISEIMFKTIFLRQYFLRYIWSDILYY